MSESGKATEYTIPQVSIGLLKIKRKDLLPIVNSAHSDSAKWKAVEKYLEKHPKTKACYVHSGMSNRGFLSFIKNGK